MLYRQAMTVMTAGRGFTDITDVVAQIVRTSRQTEALCHLFVHHTSASLLITENADSRVRDDLERFISRLAPDGDPRHTHQDEGPDDMPSHIRSVLTATDLMVPVSNGRLELGRWQGIFLWEHRIDPHHRRITATVMG